VNRAAGGLRALGVMPGDRVALFMPMCPELVAAFFAVIKIGGIVLPLFSGYGADAVTTRLQDAGVKVLITADGFWRRGQAVRMKEVADVAVAAAASVEHVIVAKRIGSDVVMGPRDVRWSDLLADRPDTCATERTGADDPLMLIYTSGTHGTSQRRRALALRLPDQDRSRTWGTASTSTTATRCTGSATWAG
jgi:acetyl-CoA synthetase